MASKVYGIRLVINIGDTRGGITAPIGDMFLPEVLGQDKMVFENFYVNDTGNKFTLYIPDFHCNSGVVVTLIMVEHTLSTLT